MTATLDTTIRAIVADDYRAAAVFQRYGIDFCCGGNRSVDDASREAGISADEVLRAVAAATQAPDVNATRFNEWDLVRLDPDARPETVVVDVRSDYREDEDLDPPD